MSEIERGQLLKLPSMTCVSYVSEELRSTQAIAITGEALITPCITAGVVRCTLAKDDKPQEASIDHRARPERVRDHDGPPRGRLSAGHRPRRAGCAQSRFSALTRRTLVPASLWKWVVTWTPQATTSGALRRSSAKMDSRTSSPAIVTAVCGSSEIHRLISQKTQRLGPCPSRSLLT